jgi:hypothetical protein
VFEYKNAKLGLHSEDLSPADVANGIGWKGYLRIKYQVSQARHIKDGIWGAWEGGLDKAPNMHGDPEGADIVHLYYKNGQWSEEVGPDVLKLPFIDFKHMIPSPKAGCADIQNALTHGSLTSEPLAAAQDGFRYMNHIPREKRLFTGTVEEFAKTLPTLMKQIISESGLYQTNWEKETAYVIAAARTCEDIIPRVAQRIRNLDALQGTKFEACHPSINVSTELNPKINLQGQRGIVLAVSIRDSKGTFILQASFTRLPSDTLISAQSTMLPDRRYLVNDYSIITATINPAPLSDKGPIPPQTLPPPAYRTLTPTAFKQFDGSEGYSGAPDASGVVLDLNLMHLQPEVLNDPRFLNYFIRLNYCGGADQFYDELRLDQQMKNEFVYPRMAAFYKEKSAEILRTVPSELGSLSFRKNVTLGQYDLTRLAFPLTSELRLDHFDIVGRRGCLSNPGTDGLPAYAIRFNPVVFREMPMDELKAREYVAGTPGTRGVVLKFDLDIVQQQPIALNGKVVFTGKIRSVGVLRSGNWPGEIAVLSPEGDANTTPYSAQNPAVSQGTPSPNSPKMPAPEDPHKNAFLRDVGSCNAGYVRACEIVAYDYIHGRGVDQNIEMARKYYQKACDLGNTADCAKSSK